MAVIMLGGGVTDIRGSIGGTCFSRGPAGAMCRMRIKPIRVRNNSVGMVRALMGYVSNYWGSVMSVAGRAGWNTYAVGTTFQNKVGFSINISGMSCFARANVLRMQVGMALITTAPVDPGHAVAPIFTATATTSDQKINIAEPSVGFDKSLDDDLLVLQQAITMGPGRTKSPHRWRTFNAIIGNNAVPPTFPNSVNATWPFLEGEMVTIRGIHVHPLGKVSSHYTYQVAAIA